MQIILLRHGEIEPNRHGLYAGRSEDPLTSKGVEQAHEAGCELATTGVEIIYASPLRRTLQTAAIVGQLTGAPVEEDAGLIEMQMGPWEKRTEKDIEREFPSDWNTWLTRPADLKIPGRETLSDLQLRVTETLSRIAGRNHKGCVILVTHYAFIRVALLCVRGADLNLYKTIKVPNCHPIPLLGPNERTTN